MTKPEALEEITKMVDKLEKLNSARLDIGVRSTSLLDLAYRGVELQMMLSTSKNYELTDLESKALAIYISLISVTI